MTGRIDRRAFLGWAATGAAGLLLPAIARPRAKVFDMGRAMIREPAGVSLWEGPQHPMPGDTIRVYGLVGDIVTFIMSLDGSAVVVDRSLPWTEGDIRGVEFVRNAG